MVPATSPPLRRLSASMVLAILAGSLAFAAFLSLGSGALAIAMTDILGHVGHGVFGWGTALSARDAAVVMDIRLPRIVLALLVGGALAVAGTALQGVFRNALADPALIGVSSGAALAASATIVVFGAGAAGGMLLPLAAFAGGLAATVLVFVLARFGGVLSVAGLLLSGIAVNALAGAGIGLFSYLGDDVQLRQLTFWLLGSLSGAGWGQIVPAGAAMVAGGAALLLQGRALDVFVLGEREAHALGIAPGPFAVRVVILVALTVGAAVSVSGIIGFVGLVVPHAVRLFLGASHQRLMPVSVLVGGLVLVVADTLARTVAIPSEVPIGLLVSLVGAPFFLWLLRHTRMGGA